jgi:hypothetical protein
MAAYVVDPCILSAFNSELDYENLSIYSDDEVHIVNGGHTQMSVACQEIIRIAYGLENSSVVPVNTVLPAITGTLEEGETVSVSTGTWTNTPTSYAYQWTAGGVAISGETSNSITLDREASQLVLGCTVIATNASGDSDPVEASGGAYVADGSLRDVTALVVAEWRSLAGYSMEDFSAGTPLWKNLIKQGDTGSNGSAYDLQKFGTWTVAGTPQYITAAPTTHDEHYMKLATDDNTAWLDSLHKTTGAPSEGFCVAVLINSDGAWNSGSGRWLISTCKAGDATPTGILLATQNNTSEQLNSGMLYGANNALGSAAAHGSYTAGNHVLFFSYWWNGSAFVHRTGVNSTTLSGTSNITPTGGTPWTNDASSVFGVLRNIGSAMAANDIRIHAIALFKGTGTPSGSSNTLLSAIVGRWESEFGIDVTP